MSVNRKRVVHFKMYKHGKTWVIAGIMALTWSASNMTSHAATTDSKPDQPQMATTTKKTVATKTAVLKGSPLQQSSPTGSQPTSAQPGKAVQSQAKQSAQSQTPATHVNSKIPQQSNRKSPAAVTEKPVSSASQPTHESAVVPVKTRQQSTKGSEGTSQATPALVTKAVNSNSKLTDAVIVPMPQPDNAKTLPIAKSKVDTTTMPVSKLPATVPVSKTAMTTVKSNTPAIQKKQAQSQTVKEPESKQVIKPQPNTTVAERSAQSLKTVSDHQLSNQVRPRERRTDADAGAGVVNQTVQPASDYAGYHQKINLDSGIFGTSEWWIDLDDGLHIGAGKLADTGFYALATNAPELINQKTLWGSRVGYITSVKFEGRVIANTDASGLFWGMRSLTAIDDFKQLDTSQSTNIAYMFSRDESLQTLNLTGLNTSHVTNMVGTFSGMRELKSLDITPLDTSQLTNVAYMFSHDESLQTLNLTGLNTSHVTNMIGTFSGMYELKNLDVTPLDTSKVTSMASLFQGDSNLDQLNIATLNTSQVQDMSYMFSMDTSLKTLDVSSFDTHQVENMTYMFEQTVALNNLDVSKFDTHLVEDMSYMFSMDSSLQTLNLANFDTQRVRKMAYMFQGMTALKKLDVSGFDTRQTRNMEGMFEDAGSDTMLAINIDNFNMRKVRRLIGMLNTTPLQISLGANTVLGLDYGLSSHSESELHPFYGIHGGNRYTGKWFDINTHQVYTTEQLFDLYRVVGHNPTATYQQQSTLEVHDSVITPETDWHKRDNFISATNADGSDVAVDDAMITLTSQPDGHQLGKQHAIYSFKNSNGEVATREAEVVVMGIALNDTSKKISTTTIWRPKDNVKRAINAQGDELTADDLSITITNNQGQLVNAVSAPGMYLVRYEINGDLSKPVTMPLEVYSLAKITTNDSAINLGASWQPADNFSAIDENGQPLTIASNGVSFAGQPNVHVPGNYQVTYRYTDASGYAIRNTATVTVVGIQLKQAAVTAITSDQWQPAMNLQRAVNADGQQLTAADLQISIAAPINDHLAKSVTLTTPGTYMVTYHFTDRLGTHQAQTQVKVISHATMVTRDQELNVNDPWHPQTGLVSATNEYGRPLAWEQLQVKGDVNTHRAGHYLVSYEYTDAVGNLTSQTAEVTVFASDTDVDAGGDGSNDLDGGEEDHDDDNHVGGGEEDHDDDNHAGGADENHGDGNHLGDGEDSHDDSEHHDDHHKDEGHLTGETGTHGKDQQESDQQAPRPTQPQPVSQLEMANLAQPANRPSNLPKPAALPQTQEATGGEMAALLGLTGLIASDWLALAGRFKRH